jgi:uncharacterized membrane protein
MYNPPPAGQPYGGLQPQEENDKILAAIAYIFTPIMSIVVLVTDMKNKPFLKYHAYQSLTVGIALIILYTVLTITFVGLCLAPALFVAQCYWAYMAYSKGTFTIPLITDLTAKFFSDFPGGNRPGGSL